MLENLNKIRHGLVEVGQIFRAMLYADKYDEIVK
jgi:hypothetical protein